MTARQIPHDEFEHVERGFFSGHTVVFIVATTDDAAWASKRTWEIARTATGRERRVALLDLSLEEPVLDQGTSGPSDEGIVDAFLYGVSLSHVARAQETTGLHYVGVGTRPADPSEVWSNPRWERLAQGFKKEGALLLAFVPPGALNRAALKPDGMIVLAPDGFDPAEDVAPGIRRRLQEGCKLLAVVSNPPSTPFAQSAPPPPVQPPSLPRLDDLDEDDEFAPTPTPPPARPAAVASVNAPHSPGQSTTQRPSQPGPRPAPQRPSAPVHQAPTPRRTAPKTPLLELVPTKPNGTRRFLIGGGLAVVATAVFLYVTLRDQPPATAATDQESTQAQPQAPETTAVALPNEPVDSPDVALADIPIESTAVAVEPPRPPVEPLTEADSLFYSIQVASFNARGSALERATEFASRDVAVTVTPVMIGQQGVFYRVLVGAFASPGGAAEARRALWRDGLVEDGEGTILRTPHSLDLGRRDSEEQAQVEAERLWGQEVAAYIMAAPDGARILVGAFENPDQAQVARSQLADAAVNATLVRRLGRPQ